MSNKIQIENNNLCEKILQKISYQKKSKLQFFIFHTNYIYIKLLKGCLLNKNLVSSTDALIAQKTMAM